MDPNVHIHSNRLWYNTHLNTNLYFFVIIDRKVFQIISEHCNTHLFTQRKRERDVERECENVLNKKLKQKKKHTPCDLSFFLSIISSPYNLLHLNNQYDWMVRLGKYAVSFRKAHL